MRVVGTIAVLMLFVAAPAIADRVDREARKLGSKRSYKTRLSAALYLSNLEDPRAIRALSRAVRKDSGRTIRRVAAASLGKLVNRSTAAGLRQSATKILKRARRSDSDRRVRRAASRALDKLSSLENTIVPVKAALKDPTSPAQPYNPANPVKPSSHRGSSSQFLIHVQAPRDATGTAPKGALNGMRRVVKDTLSPHAEVSTGRLPARRVDAHGAFVGMRVDLLRVKPRGHYYEVHCTVSIHVNPWQGEGTTERWQMDQAAQATGKGRAVAGPGRVGLGTAKLDCLMQVTKSVAKKRIVPFVRRVAVDRTYARSR